MVWPIIVESYVDEIGESMTGTNGESNNLNLGKCGTGYLAVTLSLIHIYLCYAHRPPVKTC